MKSDNPFLMLVLAVVSLLFLYRLDPCTALGLGVVLILLICTAARDTRGR